MKKILIAGIGNIFHGDDGFGCEVIRDLVHVKFPDGVMAKDFGIRSYDLAYALTDGYDVVILVDAVPRGEKPGTVCLIEADLNCLSELAPKAVDAHSMNPASVLQMAQSLGSVSRIIYVVGCEPAVLERDDIELSAPVRAAIPAAIEMIQSLIAELIAEHHTVGETVLT